ncbi:hypothetical protein PR202_gb13538 [Eleusine coracana subsp. coracana]|uniref:Rx N-terminal domain-containing protein n=1 Tax=Eleusine coracana subsp. coracana TaxID=191504 RepID=A0AAV5EQH7_ELECO|nr:hypothetical protein PR202_gb13538 [Eleusine coracana subsp. coracana]
MEAVKSASFGAMGSLLRKLEDLANTEVYGASELRDDLCSISTKIVKLSEVDDPSLTMNYWMKDVRELSYDIEDCIDQFLCSMGPDAKMAWISNLLRFRSCVEEVRDRYNRYNLDYSLRNSTAAAQHRFRPQYREPSPVFPVGMERTINQLRWQIEPKSDDENNMQLKVVSILGVEGVGKSTLTQNLWHELGGQFECKAFVQTAKQPDMRFILKNILSQIRLRQIREASQLVSNLIHDIRNHLQDKRFCLPALYLHISLLLHKVHCYLPICILFHDAMSLTKHDSSLQLFFIRYFIIIDDLRAVSVWDVLSRCFPEGNHCSRIITTTTIDDVALASCNYDPEHIYQLEPLGADDSHQLFISRVFGSGKGCPQQFIEVSADITKKCGGLPLAIICIARLIASQPETIEHWEFVRSILHHNLRARSSFAEILKLVFKLCYSTLPHCLKTCLLYLSAYPENYIFLKDDLVKQWIAEDFICTMDGMDLVEVASRYFDELLSLGLIQRMDTNSKKKGLSYVVHPAVFEFIVYKSMEDNFITVIDYSQSTVVLTDKIHRLSLHYGSATYATLPASIDVSQIRSLIFIGLLNCMPSLAEFRLVEILILHLRSDDGATRFSLTEISELLLLRYLQVRCNVIVQLPNHIQDLKHLEILEINARIAAVPCDIVHVRNLLNLSLGERKNFKHLTLSRVATDKAVSSDDSRNEPTPPLQILEFLPPICISSILPVWIYKLRCLYVLEIVVKELRMKDISVLGELPALTALSLYVRIPAVGPVIFRAGMFPVLEYFKFVSGVLSMDFREKAMPNLRTLKLGFNAHKGEQYSDMLAGIQYLLNLQKIVASIGAATDAKEFDRRAAWSALNDAIRMHLCEKNFKVKRVDRIDEEYDPSKKQTLSQESVREQEDVPKEPRVTQKEGLVTEQLLIKPAEYTEKHDDISGTNFLYHDSLKSLALPYLPKNHLSYTYISVPKEFFQTRIVLKGIPQGRPLRC